MLELESVGNYKLLQRVLVGPVSDVVVTKWRSQKTGFSVVHIDSDAPVIRSHLIIRTEPMDDSGTAHSLEHLICRGASLKYPFQWTLYHSVETGLSSAPNAFTNPDHTRYLLNSIGDEEFFRALPFFLNQVFFPALTESAHTTEVHHVNPSGMDGGALYCEMQGRENSRDIRWFTAHNLLHPGESTYKKSPGGQMDKLQESSIQQLQDFHEKFYVPHNACLIICGRLSGGTESVLTSLNREIESNFIEKGHNGGHRPHGWIRPIVETESGSRMPYKTSRVVVPVPGDKWTRGKIEMVFRGPRTEDFVDIEAFSVLSRCPISESSNGCIHLETRPDFVDLYVTLALGQKFLTKTKFKYLDVLMKFGFWWKGMRGFDMQDVRDSIETLRTEFRSDLENSKGSCLVEKIRADFVLGPEDGSMLANILDMERVYDQLAEWTNNDWKSLIKRYFLDSPVVSVQAKPSLKQARKLGLAEMKQAISRCQRLGPEGLSKLRRRVEDAKAENDTPIPEGLFGESVADLKTISWVPVQTVQEGRKLLPFTNRVVEDIQLKEYIASDGSELPFFVQFDNIQSEFITVSAWLSLASVPDHLLPFLVLYQRSLMDFPITMNNKKGRGWIKDFLNARSVDYSCSLRGIDTLCISIKVEKAIYEAAVLWLKKLVYDVIIDDAKLLERASSGMIDDPEWDERNIVVPYRKVFMFGKSNATRAMSPLVQMQIQEAIQKKLALHQSGEIIHALQKLKECLSQPSGMKFSVAGNIFDLQGPRAVWAFAFGGKLHATKLAPVRYPHQTLSEIGRFPRKKAIVVGHASNQSSYANRITRSIHDLEHPDSAALTVAVQIVNRNLLQHVRGYGIVYTVAVNWLADAGLLCLDIYRSVDVLETLRQSDRTITGLANENIEINERDVIAARNTASLMIVESETANLQATAESSFRRQSQRGLDQQFRVDAIKKIQGVSRSQVLDAIKRYIQPLVDPSTSIVISITPPHKVEETAKGLEGLGMEVEKLEYGELPASCRDELSFGRKHEISILRRWKQFAFPSRRPNS